MLDRNEVITAYRLLLGREPESEANLEHMRNFPTVDALGLALIASEEFRRRAVLGELPVTAERWVCAEIRDGLRLWLDLMDMGVGAGALRDNWEPDETKFVLEHLSPGDCFIDVGANIGWFTVLGAHRVGNTGHVISFEPRPDLFARLRDSVAANGLQARCELHNIALGEIEAMMSIAVNPEELNPGHSYLVRDESSSIGKLLHKVPVKRLDDIVVGRKVDLIKIDVEGAEALVVAGANELLRRDKPLVVTEFFPRWLRDVSGVDPELYLSKLRDIGYRIFELTSNGPGKLVENLPTGSNEDGFFVNLVASAENKVFQLRNDSPADRATNLPAAVIDERNPAAIARNIASIKHEIESLTGAVPQVEQLVRQQKQVAESLEKVNAELACWSRDSDHPPLSSRGVDNSARLDAVWEARIARIERAISRLGNDSLKPSTTFTSKIVREIRRPFTVSYWRRKSSKWSKRKAVSHGSVHDNSRDSIPRQHATGFSQRRMFAGIGKPIIAIIDDRWPEPDRDSGSIDAVNLISSFVECGYHVVVCKQSTRPQPDRYIENLRGLGAYPLTDGGASSIQSFIENEGKCIDLFVLSKVGAGGQYLELIRYNCPDAKIIFNTVDLHYVRESRSAILTGDREAMARAEGTRDREELIIGKADATFLVSSVEEEIVQASVPGSNTVVLPLARKIRWPKAGFEGRSGVGFVGGFEHQPNIDAIVYFLREIWPELHRLDPTIKFEIVGSHFPTELLENVKGEVAYLGTMPEIDEWFDSLKLSVAPLRIGAGAKGKVASSLCNGVPCVISTIAAEGMGLLPGENMLLAGTPAEFVEQIRRVHNDKELWERLSLNGLKFAEANLSVQNFKEKIRKAVIGLELPARDLR
ncbi:FkbM family methyltransferase [Agrobacterium pusense]|uniref:FkbM family methyltransferase n=1 Tax=Agrobacterium pusense TaxID=648995 RepID=UPI002867C956|nr:FkbM family methyltransferase [Agrobacterium pusense]WMW58588.1 FkbM family methyltransferase [Agrobacterium pusense]